MYIHALYEDYLKFFHLQVHFLVVVNLFLKLCKCGWILRNAVFSSLLNLLLQEYQFHVW